MKTEIQTILDNNKNTPEFLCPHNTELYNNTLLNTRKSVIFSQILTCLNKQTNILEIGALTGMITRVLAFYAKTSLIHVIDPWRGDQEGGEGEYQRFLQYTNSYNNISVNRISSTDTQANAIYDLDFSFVYVDGNHSYDYAKSDIENAIKCIKSSGLVVVDDCDMPEVNRAADVLRKHENATELQSSFMEKYFWIEK